MARFAMILSIAAFALFNYGQYLGWSLFSETADAQPLRTGSMARTYHK
jgi:Na+/melibiose symporter-like transporter